MKYLIYIVSGLSITLFAPSCTEQESPSEGNDVVDEVVSDPLFELLEPESTGILFSNQIKETFLNNIMINAYLYNGGGVAVLDANNDGLPDLYLNATQETNRLYLNKGNWQFEDITESAGVSAMGGNKTGVTVVDINADGWQDLYICRSGMDPQNDRHNLLFINNGDLTFTEKSAEYGLDNRSASNLANFFDYDLDGDLDVYIMNHPIRFGEVNRVTARTVDEGDFIKYTEPYDEWESDRLYRNDGNGKFTNVSEQAGIRNSGWGLSVTVSYFNDDNYPDIFVGNDYIEADFLYINNGNGTFTLRTDDYFRHMSNLSMGADIADINNDGLIDVAVVDMIAEDNQRQKELVTTMKLDRYNSLVQYHYGHQIERNMLQLNTGAPAGEGAPFSDIGTLAGVSNTDWSWSPLLVDFNNDGLKDLHITNGYFRDVSNADYVAYTVDSVLRIGGLNNRNFKTIYEYLELIPQTPLKNYMYKNVDGIRFEDVTDSWGMGQPSYSNGSAFADLDLDGDLDLIVNQIEGDVLVYRNYTSDRNEGNWLQIVLEGSEANPAGTGARVRIFYDGDKMQYQELTPTRGFFSSSEHLLHFGLRDVSKVDKLEILWPGKGHVQAIENVDVNQRMTLKYTDARPGTWDEIVTEARYFEPAEDIGIEFRHEEDHFIDFYRERLIPHKFSNLGPSMAVADVNGDGTEDFYIGGAKDQAGALFIQRSNSTFSRTNQQVWEEDKAFEDMGCIFFDADGDGDQDLYVASGGSTDGQDSRNYQDRIYFNDGSGNFTRAPFGVLPVITASGSCVTAMDYDNDGDQDIFVGGLVTPGSYPSAPMTCLLQNDGGRFTDVCKEVAPELNQIGMVNDMHWTDLDGDGSQELLVAGEWLPITVFKVEKGQLRNVTEQYGLGKHKGWWNCIKSADLDGDGDMDLVAGNLGLNSRLKASQEYPLQLYAKDFDNNGSIDPIMAYYYDDKLYPLPLRDMIIAQLPHLKKKYVFHKDYGKATLGEVFSAHELESAVLYEATTFANTWFENRDGKMIPHELPIQAQFAPCNDIMIKDFNGDSSPDLLLVGNTSSPEVETGRYDAANGDLLLNNGKGTFTHVRNVESGFWATREARDLAVVKLANGRSLYLVANNNDELQAYIQ